MKIQINIPGFGGSPSSPAQVFTAPDNTLPALPDTARLRRRRRGAVLADSEGGEDDSFGGSSDSSSGGNDSGVGSGSGDGASGFG